MDDLVARLVEGEISLGLALVDVAQSTLTLGNTTEFEQARQRAQAAYLRARAHILELPEHSQQTYTVRLQALQSAIDELPASESGASAKPDSVPSVKKIIDSPA
jgi:uncharacterized protein HemX